MIGIIIELAISSHDNLVGYDQKPHLTSVSGRIPSCPIPEHYINMFKTPFEAFGQITIKHSQPLSSTQNQGPKQRIKAWNQRGNTPNLLFNLFSLQFCV